MPSGQSCRCGGEATLYQRFNNGVGPGNGGENLPGPVRCLDIAEANLQMAWARLTAANEGRVDAQGDRGGGRCRFSRSGIPQVLANLERLGAQGFGIGPGIEREQLLEHAGCNTVGQEGGKLRPDLVELGSRAALRRPLNPSLIGPTAGTAEAWQSNRDRAEQGGNPVGTIIFDPACGTAGPACRPLGGMIPALGLRPPPVEPGSGARRKPRSARSSRLPGRSISSTSTLPNGPSTPVSTRRKIHPIPDPQSLKLPGRHTPSTRHPQLLDAPAHSYRNS